MIVTINGKRREVRTPELPYETIVAMACLLGPQDPTVVYCLREGRGGSVRPGEVVEVHDEMTFTACYTGAA